MISKPSGFSRWFPIFRMVSKLSGFFPDDCQFSGWFQNCPDFPDYCKFSGLFQNCPDFPVYCKFAGWFQNCLNISRWLKNLSDSFKTVWKLTDDLKFSTGKFPDNFKLFFHCFGDAQIFDFYLIMHFAALSWGAITRFFGFLRETLTHASSGKFLHVESCYLESFGFFCLWSQHTRLQFNKGNGIILVICAKMEYLSYW